MKKVIKSRPSVMTILITIIVCLDVALLVTGGIHPPVILVCALLTASLMRLSARDQVPNSFEARDAKAYSYHTEARQVLGEITSRHQTHAR